MSTPTNITNNFTEIFNAVNEGKVPPDNKYALFAYFVETIQPYSAELADPKFIRDVVDFTVHVAVNRETFKTQAIALMHLIKTHQGEANYKTLLKYILENCIVQFANGNKELLTLASAMIQLLGKDSNIHLSFSNTDFFEYAVQIGFPLEIIQELLETGAVDINQKNQNGYLSFLYPSPYTQSNCIRFLINKVSAVPPAQGFSLLQQAITQNDKELIECCFENAEKLGIASILDNQDHFNRSLLDFGQEKSHFLLSFLNYLGWEKFLQKVPAQQLSDGLLIFLLLQECCSLQNFKCLNELFNMDSDLLFSVVAEFKTSKEAYQNVLVYLIGHYGLEMVKKKLLDGQSISEIEEEIGNALYRKLFLKAIVFGNLACIQEITKAGLFSLEYAFILAAEVGNETLMAALLDQEGVDIETTGSEDSKCTALDSACICGTTNSVKFLLSRGASTAQRDGSTPLHRVITSPHGTPELVNLLLENGISIEEKDEFQNTPLGTAAKLGKVAMINLLLDKGADILAKNADGETPLHQACASGPQENVFALLEYAEKRELTEPGFLAQFLSSQNNQQETPLHLSVLRSEENLIIVKFLIKYGAPLNARDHHGQTPLHNAVLIEASSDLIALFIRSNADIRIQDNRGRIPLHHAAEQGNIEFALALTASDQDSWLIQDGASFSPLDLAARRGNIEFLSAIKTSLVDPDVVFQISTPAYIAGLQKLFEENPLEGAILSQFINFSSDNSVREMLTLTLEVLRERSHPDKLRAEEIKKYIEHLLSTTQEGLSFLTLVLQNNILYSYLVDQPDYLIKIRKMIALLPKGKQLDCLPFLSPTSAFELISAFSEEEKEHLLQIDDIETKDFNVPLSLRNALMSAQDQWIQYLKWEGEESNSRELLPIILRLLAVIPLSSLAIAATDEHLKKILISCLRACNANQLQAIIPQLSEEDLILALQTLPERIQIDCLKASRLLQKEHYIKVYPSLIPLQFVLDSGQNALKEARVNCEQYKAFAENAENIEKLHEDLMTFLYADSLKLKQKLTDIESLTKLISQALIESGEYDNALEESVKKPTADNSAKLPELEKLIADFKSLIEEAESLKPESTPPDEFLDEITGEVMVNPVKLPSGHFVDESTLERLTKKAKTEDKTDQSAVSWEDPFSRKNFDIKEISEASSLKSQMQEWQEKKGQKRRREENT